MSSTPVSNPTCTKGEVSATCLCPIGFVKNLNNTCDCPVSYGYDPTAYTCTQCTSQFYSASINSSCLPLPANSTRLDDGSFFICNNPYIYSSDGLGCTIINAFADSKALRTTDILNSLSATCPAGVDSNTCAIQEAHKSYVLPLLYYKPPPINIPSVLFPSQIDISGSTATITAVGHGLSTGSNVYLSGFGNTSLNGGPDFVTKVDSSRFSVQTTATGTSTPGQVLIQNLPLDLTSNLANCVLSDTCNYIAYDFLTSNIRGASNLNYIIDTSQTGARDASVFIKNRVRNPTVLSSPPGYTYSSSMLPYISTQTPITKDVDACANSCNDTPGCSAFNHDQLINSCQLVLDLSQGLSGDYSQSYVGYIKEVIDHYTLQGNITAPDLSNEGSLCMDYMQCNFDMNVLTYSNVGTFTTNDIMSCAYCPLRAYEGSMGTGNVTNEVGTTYVTSPAGILSQLMFQAGTFTVPNLTDGGYTVTPWIPDTHSTSLTSSLNVFVYRNMFFYKDATSNLYGNIPLCPELNATVLPTTYVSNGYTLNVQGKGMISLGSQPSIPHYEAVNGRLNCTLRQPTSYSCPSYTVLPSTCTSSVVSQPYYVNGVRNSGNCILFTGDCTKCYGATIDNLELGTADYNHGIFIFTPRPDSVGSFFNSIIRSNTYVTDTKGSNWSITLGAPNFKKVSTLSTPITISQTDTNCQTGSVGFCTLSDSVYISNTYGLSTGSEITIKNQNFIVNSVMNYQQLTLSTKYISGVTSNITDLGITIQTTINKTLFPVDASQSISYPVKMLDFYNDSGSPQTPISAASGGVTQLLGNAFNKGEMPDPYEQFGLFRSLYLPPRPTADTGRIGCDRSCPDTYVAYNCYGNLGISCDKDAVAPLSDDLTCRGTYKKCTPDRTTLLNQWSRVYSNLYATDIFRADTVRGLNSQERNSTDIQQTMWSSIYSTETSLNADSDNWGTIRITDTIGNFTISTPQNAGYFIPGLTLILSGSTNYISGFSTQTEAQYTIAQGTNGTSTFRLLKTDGSSVTTTPVTSLTGVKFSIWEYGTVRNDTLEPANRYDFPYWSHSRFTNQAGNQNTDGFLESAYGCPAGYYVMSRNQIQYCEVCPAGTYSPGGHTVTQCFPCTLGNYCRKGSAYNGPPCAAGSFCPDPKTQIVCPAGYFCQQSVTNPTSCDREDTLDGTFRQISVTATYVGPAATVRISGYSSNPTFLPGTVGSLTNLLGSIQLLSTTLTSAIFNIVVLQNYSTVNGTQTLSYHTSAHYCPIGSSLPQGCSGSNYCPFSEFQIPCSSGYYCPSNVFAGIRCPADTYYRAPQLTGLNVAQLNADGSHCYQCPIQPGTTTRYPVNANQDGCVCPNASLTWSLEQEVCVLNCPAGQFADMVTNTCQACPAGTFSEVLGTSRACVQCPDNFNSSANAAKTGCTCTNIRKDGFVVNGTVTWNSTYNRCQLTSCPVNYSVYWSNCIPNNIPGTPVPITATSCLAGQTLFNGVCYKCIDLSYDPIVYYQDYETIITPPPPGYTGVRWFVEINDTFTAPAITSGGSTIVCNGNHTVTTRVEKPTPHTAASTDGWPNTVTAITKSPTIVCPPCYSNNTSLALSAYDTILPPASLTNMCLFTKTRTTQNNACFTCPTSIIYEGGLQIYQNVPPTGGYCPIVGSLPLWPSLWGNDGSTPRITGSSPGDNLLLALRAVFTGTPYSTYFTPGRDGAQACSKGYNCMTGQVCSPGYYCGALVGGLQELCPPGYYCPAGTSEPTPCLTSGTYCPWGSSAAITCPAGSYCPNTVSNIYCPGGKYNSFTGRTSFTDCLSSPAGSYSLAGATSSTTCSPGSYCPTETSLPNPDCAEGSYCPNTSTIFSCPPGYYCPPRSSWLHILCNRTQKVSIVNGANACVDCPLLQEGQIWDSSFWTSTTEVILPLTSVNQKIFASPNINNTTTCLQKSVLVTNGASGAKFTGVVTSYNSATGEMTISNIPAQTGSGTYNNWIVTLYGCDTIQNCTGHSTNNATWSECKACTVPTTTQIWSTNTGCGITNCPSGGALTTTSPTYLYNPITAPVTMGLVPPVQFKVGSQVLVYNSQNTSFVGTVGLCNSRQVIFNEIDHLTTGASGQNNWTLQQYGCA